MTSTTEYTQKDLRRITFAQSVRIFLLAVVLVASGLLIADNTHDVNVGWLFGEDSVNLAVVLAIAAGAGLVAGLLVAWPVGRSMRWRADHERLIDLESLNELENEERAYDDSYIERGRSVTPPAPPGLAHR